MSHGTQPRLLYLSFAFPPGVQNAFPRVNPAGHLFETEMIRALREFCDIRSIGLLPGKGFTPHHKSKREKDLLSPALSSSEEERENAPRERDIRFEAPLIGGRPVSPHPGPLPRGEGEESPGLQHELILSEHKPEVLARWQAASQLQRWYSETVTGDWKPDAILNYNLSPVYNRFIRSLCETGDAAKRVLLLADSSSLGQAISRWKRFRRRFKPMHVPDQEAIESFDACIGLSPETKRFFAGKPWMWMPGACSGQPLAQKPQREQGPIRFAYFGALAAHSGIMELIDCFLDLDLSNTLHVCGYGKLSDEIALRARQNPRLQFAGQLPSTADCLNFAADADVLINPRPASHGNANNFPSKLFQYALTGRSILTSRLSGTDDVLGPNAFYFNEQRFATSLSEALRNLSTLARLDLDRLGLVVQERVLGEYNWPAQARRVADFIRGLL